MKRNLITLIRNSKSVKMIAAFIAVNIITQLGFPTISFALTSGPGQEEFSSFEPASTTDMVDLYTGDFTYNIPIVTIPGPNGGYPINLAYHSGVTMEQEASWVGLGWSLNVGSINRQIRGLPDDYNPRGTNLGYNVTHNMHYNTSWTANIDVPVTGLDEAFGVPLSSYFSLDAGIYYNNFKGLGYRVFMDFMYPSSQDGGAASVGVGLSFDSQNGIGIEPDFSVNGSFLGASGQAGISASYNSQEGLQDINVSASIGVKGKNEQLTRAKTKKRAAKNFTGHRGYDGGSTLSFSTTQLPGRVTMPMSSSTFSFHAAFGAAAAGLFTSYFPALWNGSFTTSSSTGNNIPYGGYGYNYIPTLGEVGSIVGTPGVEEDFQRDDIPYSDNVPNLAPSCMTYDIYTQTGQGTGNMFRPYLSSVGIVTDPTVQSQSSNAELDFELGTSVGDAHVKVGLNSSSATTTSGPWQPEGSQDIVNNLKALGFVTRSLPSAKPDYEPFYFQVYGEKSAIPLYGSPSNSDNFFNSWGGDQALRVELSQQTPSWFNSYFQATDNFLRISSGYANSASQMNDRFGNNKNNRQIRGTSIETFTNTQAVNQFGYSTYRNGTTYTFDDATPGGRNNTPKNFHLTDAPKGISEMSVLQSDGMRYIYGLPQYNMLQKNATFSVPGPNNAIFTKAAVPGSGTTIDPSSTFQGYLSETDLNQPYANSWLLTEVVSDDYVDVSGNGPSDDDYGYWVKFKYKRTSANYQWRTPYQDANYIDGMKNYPNDDKGAFSYGQKELYYLDTIETKTNIVVFVTSPRQDGIAAANEIPGGLPPSPSSGDEMYELDQIKLFAKTQAYLANPSAAIPIKVINFRYSYNLCPQVDNNTGAIVYAPGTTNNLNANKGKLTLDTLFFTYQNSSRGEQSPYIFTYSSNNPAYSQSNYDRWGDYKKNEPNTILYPFSDFPYTDQYYYDTKSNYHYGNVTVDAGAWSLTGITLPTGGTIDVNYEKNDYAYVENQRANAMFDIDGMGPNPPAILDTARYTDPSPVPTEFGGPTNSPSSSPYVVWFRLEQPYSTYSSPGQFIVDKYLNGGAINNIFYKVYCNLTGTTGSASTSSTSDYVSGYCNIFTDAAHCGVDPISHLFGYVTLVPVPINSVVNYTGMYISPITRSCMEYLRADRPEILYNFSQSASNSAITQVTNLLGSIPNLLSQLEACIQSYNVYAYQNGYGQNIYCNGRSIIRLEEPSGFKIGGGSRVAELDMHDNWVNAGSADFYYGQKYNYTTTDPSGNTISSGVAYEPEIGQEESALSTPVTYNLSNLFASTYHLFVQNPIMKSYYPGASVGYSKVTVTSVGKSEATSDNPSNTLARSAAPLSIYEFYTPKDFPVIFDQTDLTTDAPIVRPLLIPGIYTSFKKRKARSQGYSVVLNDMAGKMKRLTVMTQPANASPGNIVSEQDYNYQTVQPYDPNNINQLCDTVQVLTQDGSYEPALMGETGEAFIDMNENCQQSNSFGLSVDVETGITPPLLYIMPFPFLADNNLSTRTIVTNKVIYRTGILQSVVTTTDGSKVTESNLAYDPQTGEPLLTSVTNEFDAPVYKYSYPAYWYYGAMGGAYQNFGLVLRSLTAGASGAVDITSDIPGTANASNYYIPGDQVYVFSSSYPGLYTVASVYGNILTLIDNDLPPAAGGNYIHSCNIDSMEVVKSGFVNMQNSKAGTLVAEGMSPGIPVYAPGSPASSSSGGYGFTGILDAKAVEYGDNWNILCDANGGSGPPCNLIGTTVNPWLIGLEGIWRPTSSWVYEDARYQAGVDHISTDGVYMSSHNNHFSGFPWANPSSVSNTDWVVSNLITLYSPYGYELENQNAVGVYSAALYGYNNSLVTAIAHNARYHQIAFDGFEDYPHSIYCAENDFAFSGTGTITSSQAHTGNYSIALAPGQTMSASKALYSGIDSLCPAGASPFTVHDTAEGVGVHIATYTTTIGGTTTSAVSIPVIFPGIFPNDLPVIGTGPTGPITQSVPTAVTPTIVPGYIPTTYSACNCIGEFWASAGQQYIISAWVKETTPSHPTYNSMVNYPDPVITIQFYNSTPALIQTNTYKGSGNMIEDWQRVYGVYTVPAGAVSMTVTLSNSSSSSTVYFDDFRMSPFASNLTTYVYDDINTFRVMAELDPNNYATVYNYDDEGHLTAVKKETVSKGLTTIKEGRINNTEQ